MSLLEDVFLEDEAGEAQELERVIEGDEFDERPRSAASNSDDNSEKEDEAEEDKRRVDPTKPKATRVVKNPRVTLNPARLTGPRGIQVIPDHFKDFNFKGKGHEKEDLDLVLKKLEHWAYRLFPKFEFGDCLKKIETLGKKRPVMVHLHKIRSDQYTTEDTVVQRDSSDDEPPADQPQEEDEFDKLLQQQIELARATPAPGSVTKRGFETPSIDKRSPFTMPKATSSPSISDEQRDRMIRNRQLAEERRLARLKQNTSANASPTTVDLTNEAMSNGNVIEVNSAKKQSKSNVLDSSDDENTNAKIQPVIIDVPMHDTTLKGVTKVNDDTSSNTNDREELNVNVTMKKHNRLNVIDSSDDEDTNAVNQIVTVDVEMHETELSNEKADKNTYDMPGEELNDVTEDNNITIDLINEVPVKHSNIFKEGQVIDIIDEDSDDIRIRKENKRNVVDSSDEECEMTSVNQSVSVHVHYKNTETNTENDEGKRRDKKNIYSDNETVGTDEDYEDIQNKMTEKESKIKEIEVTTEETAETATTEQRNENDAVETITNVKNASRLLSEVTRDNKENMDSNVQQGACDAVDDLMEADFSNDF